ncbi:MAG TPA: Zn-ribbon domain-containing OB-fold protein [Dehalococcoidia bacterium]|nr:Zn-ribbon domain-containing OB-fold protein [Dehalococcoidia bacterium]
MTNAPARPLPTPQPESDFYFQKAKQHELWLMRCKDCNQAYFYPRAICPNCFSRNTEWFQSSGKGTLYAFAIVQRAPTPAFADMVPYVTAFVELEGGVRIPTNLVDVEPDPAKVKIGMAVEVVFDDVTSEITLPKFRPA